MRILAVIPCRRNSTRVAGKNTLVIGGKPNLLWTIEALRACSRELTIAVLTDDPRAAAIATEAGVLVVDEPPEVAGNDNLWVALGYAMQEVVGTFDCLMLAPACNPIRPTGYFDSICDKLAVTGCDGVMSVAQVRPHQHPRFLHLLIDGERPVSVAFGPVGNSQDFTPLYCDAALGYVWTWATAERNVVDRWMTARTTDIRAIQLTADQWVDIDEPIDVEWAEFLLSRKTARG